MTNGAGVRFYMEDDLDRSWFQDGKCRGEEPSVMYPTPTAVDEAKAICAGCPVQETCLEFALATREEYGVWGGMDSEERRLEIRRRVKRQEDTHLPQTMVGSDWVKTRARA